MLSAAENELLTRVGPETPMGGMMRRYWLPVVLSCLALLVLAGAMGTLHVVSQRTTPREKGIRGYDQLNPRVTISRSDGEVVTEGVMPRG